MIKKNNRLPLDVKSLETISGNYIRDNSGVYFFNINWTFLTLPWADPQTFVLYKYNYSKDKNKAYLYEKPLPLANPATFEVLDKAYAKDDIHVWRYGELISWINGKKIQIIGRWLCYRWEKSI